MRMRISPATAISLLALFGALGGTSYAMFSVPRNSVGTKQLKNNAVTNSKIKNDAVSASKINASGLTVPNATNATNAINATSATNATNATNAGNANALQGERASSPAPSAIASAQIVGAAGEPAYQNS